MDFFFFFFYCLQPSYSTNRLIIPGFPVLVHLSNDFSSLGHLSSKAMRWKCSDKFERRCSEGFSHEMSSVHGSSCLCRDGHTEWSRAVQSLQWLCWAAFRCVMAVLLSCSHWVLVWKLATHKWSLA